ncbi:MAG: MHYT domain-containing protein [Rhodospirillaceae bacterium]
MSVTHEPWLVLLSLAVAFQGCFVALGLAVQLRAAPPERRRWLLAGSALTLGLAIWSMHFVGMMATRLPAKVDFLVLPTLLSFLVCVLVAGIAVFVATNRRLTPIRLGASALFMGTGICTMHHLGMYALHSSLQMSHAPIFVITGCLSAILASALAIWLVFGTGKRPPMIVSALVLALAISIMHYLSMAGMTVSPKTAEALQVTPTLDQGTLAILVSCVAFLVSGLFLLSIVPTQPASGTETSAANPAEKPTEMSPAEVQPIPQTASAMLPEAPKPAIGLQSIAQASTAPATSRPYRVFPIEREGRKAEIPVEDIYAIQADSHYTKLFDGTQQHFCPLSISEAERRLDKKTFNRVHRSHVVNLSRVARYKKSGDGGQLILHGQAGQVVPVSRSRWSRVRAKLAALDQDAPIVVEPVAQPDRTGPLPTIAFSETR